MEDKQDFTETFEDVEVHVVFSRGKFVFMLDNVVKHGDDYSITISNAALNRGYVEEYTGSVSAAGAAKLMEYFEEESPEDLSGNVFCTVERAAAEAFHDMLLNIQYGLDREAPSSESIFARIVEGAANEQPPDTVTNLLPNELYRYLLTLFDMSSTDPQNSEASEQFIQILSNAVNERSGGKVKIERIPDGEPLPLGTSNSLRDIRLKVTGASQHVLQLCPASNGVFWVAA